MAVSQSGRAARGPAVGSVYLWLVALVSITVLGGLVYQAFLPHHGPAPLGRFENLWALPAAAMTMQLTNTASVTLMVGLQLRRSPRQILHLMRQPPGPERVGLFLIGLTAPFARAQYSCAPLVMPVPA